MASDLEKLAGKFKGNEFKDFRASLMVQAGIARQLGAPERFLSKAAKPQAAVETAIPQRGGLEPIRLAIEIPTVSEELYARTREAVEETGYNFIVPIRSVSIEDLLAEDRQREQEGKPRRFRYVDDSKIMRATAPPEMEVAINPERFRIEKSNRLSTDEQKKKIKQEQALLRKQVRQDIQNLINMEMVDPSTLSQLEDAYMARTGRLLLPDYFARTDVQTVPGSVAYVGRDRPTRRLNVAGWPRGDGRRFIFAVSVVVLPRKLAA